MSRRSGRNSSSGTMRLRPRIVILDKSHSFSQRGASTSLTGSAETPPFGSDLVFHRRVRSQIRPSGGRNSGVSQCPPRWPTRRNQPAASHRFSTSQMWMGWRPRPPLPGITAPTMESCAMPPLCSLQTGPRLPPRIADSDPTRVRRINQETSSANRNPSLQAS